MGCLKVPSWTSVARASSIRLFMVSRHSSTLDFESGLSLINPAATSICTPSSVLTPATKHCNSQLSPHPLLQTSAASLNQLRAFHTPHFSRELVQIRIDAQNIRLARESHLLRDFLQDSRRTALTVKLKEAGAPNT